jgi:polyisoprenoid-binding protein YceI
MRKLLLLLLLIYTASSSKSQTVYVSDSGQVSFYSYALLEDITATTGSVNGLLNALTGEIAFIIPIRSFKFAKSLMQEHFNEKYMESDKFPNATYKGNIIEKPDYTAKGTYPVTSKGKLTIHGIEKEVNESGTLQIDSGRMVLNSTFRVALQDFNITKPSLLFNNIADTIDVKINAIYHPFKKK